MADLQSLFAKVEGASVAVDLLKVSQSLAANGTNNGGNKPNHKLRLALDIEGCLDRFYGGYYSGMCAHVLPDLSIDLCQHRCLTAKHTYRLGVRRPVEPGLPIRPAARQRL